MSIGEDRVRTKFNPSAVGLVDQIKQKTAELINLCNEMTVAVAYEKARSAGQAMDLYEAAAEKAVKAATYDSFVAGK
jgi:hypothetical protein